MRVLIIMPWIRQGGAELIAVETAFYLGKLGHKVKLAALFVETSKMNERAGEIDYVTPSGWVSTLCQRNKWFLYFLGPFFLFFLVLVSAKEVDVLFAHSLPAHWIGSIVGKIKKKAVVWLCNEPAARISLRETKTLGWADFMMWFLADSFLDKALVRGVQRIIVYSKTTAEEVRGRYGREPTIVRLGVDVEFFRKKVLREVETLRQDCRLSKKFVLLVVGKLHPQENQGLTIEVLAELMGRIPQARLVLVGAGPDEESLRKKTKSLKVEDKVVLTGFCSPGEVRAWYHLCDLVLFPPLPRGSGVGESWGFVPIEALCARKLSIVSEGSGVAGLLREKKMGIVISPKVEEFVKQILQFYKKPKKFEALTERGFSFVKENLSWENYARQVEAILEKSKKGEENEDILTENL